MSEELKPCPFCGGNDPHIYGIFQIKCNSCGMFATANPRQWNLRPAQATPVNPARELSGVTHSYLRSAYQQASEDGATESCAEIHSILATSAALEPKQATNVNSLLPVSYRRDITTAIAEARNPKGMSPHNGMGYFNANQVERLLVAFDHVCASPVERKPLTEDIKDAERYRHLRNTNDCELAVVEGDGSLLVKDWLDQAIDRAIESRQVKP